MITIRVDVEIPKYTAPLPSPASEWMFEPVNTFFTRLGPYTPYWTGALRTSNDMREMDDGSGYVVKSGSPSIINPITKTPTDEYAPIQEALKGYMADAWTVTGTRTKLDNAANRLFFR